MSPGETRHTASKSDSDCEPSASELGNRRAIGINYHFVRGTQSGPFQLRAHETPERFAEQLARLCEDFGFCRARELADPGVALHESSILLTFDDGAKDVVEHALPILRRYSATATVYVCAQPYLDGRLLEIQKIEFLMQRLGLEAFREAFYAQLQQREIKPGAPLEIERESLEFAGGYEFYRYDDERTREFKLDLNYQLPYAVLLPALDSLFRSVFGEGAEAAAIEQIYLSRDDLKRLQDAGLELGVHTQRHRVLPRLDLATQTSEIAGGMEFLRDLTGEERFTVAYPYGFHDDRTQRAMENLGAIAGLTMARRMITPEDLQSRWSLPRYDVNDCFDRETNEIDHAVFSQLSTRD